MHWWEWLLLASWVLLLLERYFASRIPPSCWYLSRRKRTAMQLALKAAEKGGQDIFWSRSRIARADHEKYFVLVQNSPPVGRTPEGYRLYAVWKLTGQV